MNLKFSGLLAGAAVIALSSCSSIYKSGQTHDDVYYSPGKAVSPMARNNNSNNAGDEEAGSEYLETNGRSGNRSVSSGYGSAGYQDDQYLRMMIASGRRGYFYDDLYYNGGLGMMDPYMLNNWRFNSMLTWNSGFYSPYSSLWYWNSFYNPYYTSFYNPYYGYYGGGGFLVGGGKGGIFNYKMPSRPSSSFAMGSYLNTNGRNNMNSSRPGRGYGNYNNSNQQYYNGNNNRRSAYGADNNNSNNRSYNNTVDRPVRSYTPSSNSGSYTPSRSGSSSGGGGVSRPARVH